ncbi:MAG: hypothetical protein KDK70_13065, partial [Myxococcales bacterium]|nr:hypothetical protein [Myxococcales bacterium]
SPLLGGCATGGDDTGFSSFGPSTVAGTGTAEETDSADSSETDAPGETSAGSAEGTTGGDDGGNPRCCEISAEPGCGSVETESCVCADEPACCQAVWSAECVEMAIACGDPYCVEAGDSGTEDTGDTGTTTGDELECDPDFSFSPANPAPGVPFTATFTDPIGLTWVGMVAEGSGGSTIDGSNLQISGGPPFFWSYDFAGLAAGVWTFSFTHRESENGPDLVRGTCQKQF